MRRIVILATATNQMFNPKITNRIAYNFSRRNLAKSPKLQAYDAIKNKQQRARQKIEEKSTRGSIIRNQIVNQASSLQVQQNRKEKSVRNDYKCDGCNAWLQSEDHKKFGFINQKVLQEALEQNKKLIHDSYGEKANNKDSRAINMLHQVQKQTGIPMFDQNDNQIKNLDNLQVLMSLQNKIDRYEADEQLLRRSKNNRKQILCFRCYSLNYHNRLPEEYDTLEMDPTKNQEYINNRLFHRHNNQDTHFLYLIDILDVAGTFQFQLFQRLVQGGYKFSLLITKSDIVNKKYLNINFLRDRVVNRLREYWKRANLPPDGLNQIQIFLLSNTTKDGLSKIKQFMENSKTQKFQLLGYPNTGKTTLLNALTHLKKTISKIPGTTTKVTENQYKGGKLKIYDMPGLFSDRLLYNLIQKPSLKSLLTWDKFYSPPLLTHQVIFFGGKVQIYGVRIVVFGLGGASSANNQWFMRNYKQFWKGLPQLSSLNIQKHQIDLTFKNGETEDLQIQGFGFIGFRICERQKLNCTKKLTLYLPWSVGFSLSKSALSTDLKTFNLKDAIKKQHMLQRIHKQNKIREQNLL